MLISKSHHFIFIHIYKVAGTSIKKALYEYSIKPDIITKLYKNFGIKRLSPYQHEWIIDEHATAEDAKNRLPVDVYDEYFKFTFVRNPWDWQVSMYSNMLQSKKHFQHHLVRSMSGFEEYIEWRVSEDKYLQSEFITDEKGEIIVDYVGRFERLSSDFYEICDKLNIETILPHSNASIHRDYRTYYDKRTKRIVADHFSEDIDLFGYTFEGMNSSQ